MSSVPRRVVTGHTPNGVSVVVSDGPVPVSRDIPGVAFHDLEHGHPPTGCVGCSLEADLDR